MKRRFIHKSKSESLPEVGTDIHEIILIAKMMMWILKKRTNKSICWSINHRRGKLNISISKWGSPSYVRDKKFNPKSSGAAIINIKSLGCVNIDKVLAFHESGTCASPPFCDFNKLHTGQHHVLLLSLMSEAFCSA